MDVEMRHLRALVAVAEELNFTRAAERLHLTQQALSGQIRQLEARVGTQLVERDTRRVALTPAGEAMCRRARPLLFDAQLAVDLARATGEQTQGLTLGFVAPLTRRAAGPLFERLARDHPEIELRIHFGSFLDPTGGLREALSDVALLYGRFDHQGIELRHLFSEPRGIVMARDHRLASKPEVTLEDFLAEPLVDVPIPDTICRDFWIAAGHRGGRPPRIGASVQTMDALVEAVGAGLGVAATIELTIDLLGLADMLAFRPLPDLEPLDFWAARRGGDERPQVTAFMDAAQRAYETWSEAPPGPGPRPSARPTSPR